MLLAEPVPLSRFPMVSGVIPFPRVVALSAVGLTVAEVVPESTTGRWSAFFEHAGPMIISVPLIKKVGRFARVELNMCLSV
jgi:hypothetical protein